MEALWPGNRPDFAIPGEGVVSSRVWSCNEWDPLEEVIVGNPLKARYPTPDLSTQLAEFPDNLVVVDRNQPSLIKLLEKRGFDVAPLKLRHSKLLGDGPHCVTLDIRRRGVLQRYFN
jgi:hypothetical protein